MHSNSQALVVHTVIIAVIILITYMQATIYIPFQNVVEVENIVEPTSKITITKPDANDIIDVSSERFRVKTHNLFNDLKISRNFFISKSEMSLPNYVLEIEFIGSNNEKVTRMVTILNNGNININGDTFTTSKNIYSEIENIVNIGN